MILKAPDGAPSKQAPRKRRKEAVSDSCRPLSPTTIYGRPTIKDVPAAPRAPKPVLHLHEVNRAMRWAMQDKLNPPTPRGASPCETTPSTTAPSTASSSATKERHSELGAETSQAAAPRHKAASTVGCRADARRSSSTSKACANCSTKAAVSSEGSDGESQFALAPVAPPFRFKCLEDYIFKEKRERLSANGSPRLVWCKADADADYYRLGPGEFFNHFQHNHELTTKAALANNLLEHSTSTGANVDRFFPRCYDVMQRGERDDFILDFRRSAALQVAMLHIHLDMQQRGGEGAASYECNLDMLTAAKHTLQRWCHDLDPCHLDEEGDIEVPRLSEDMWDALVLYSELTEGQLCAEEGPARQPRRRHYRIGGGGIDDAQLCEQTGASSSSRPANIRAWPEFEGNRWGLVTHELQKDLEKLTTQIEQGHSQWALQNSNCGRNVWIVKPGTNSKGSGVVCMTALPDLLRHCDVNANRIIQRYIERPLLLFGGRKFDIRQWVLVRSVMPLRVFVFSECYLRFCNEVYDLDDLRNRERHISNWQVNRHGKHIVDGAVASLPEFKEELLSITGNERVWEDKLWPQLCDSVVQTLRAAEGKLKSRRENFELYGFDFMVDESLNVWLLEVNLSPGCEGRTPFLNALVQRMVRRLIDVAVFAEEEPDGEQPDWVNICDDAQDGSSSAARNTEAVRPTPRGLDLTVFGHALRAPRRSRRSAASKGSGAAEMKTDAEPKAIDLIAGSLEAEAEPQSCIDALR